LSVSDLGLNASGSVLGDHCAGGSAGDLQEARPSPEASGSSSYLLFLGSLRVLAEEKQPQELLVRT